MFRAKLPFVVVDPVRSWWGLRSSRADGGQFEDMMFRRIRYTLDGDTVTFGEPIEVA
jgi:hypothetical protein